MNLKNNITPQLSAVRRDFLGDALYIQLDDNNQIYTQMYEQLYTPLHDLIYDRLHITLDNGFIYGPVKQFTIFTNT